MKWGDQKGIAQAILEIMCALWMADLGIGPPVYAAGIVGHTLDRSVLVCPKVDVPKLVQYTEVGVTHIFRKCDELGECQVVHLDLKPDNVGFGNRPPVQIGPSVLDGFRQPPFLRLHDSAATHLFISLKAVFLCPFFTFKYSTGCDAPN